MLSSKWAQTLRFWLLFSCLFLLTQKGLAEQGWQQQLKLKIEQKNYPKWMLEQIEEELAPFSKEGISLADIYETAEFNNKYSTNKPFVLCHIKNGYLHHVPALIPESDFRAQRLINGLQALLQAVALPDLIFIVFTCESFIDEGNKAPILTWCKHLEKGKKALSFPDYDALGGNYECLEQVRLGIERFPWESKKDAAIWRGGLTGGYGDSNYGKADWDYMLLPRLQLAQISNIHPTFVDAKLVGQIGRSEQSKIRKKTLPYTGNFLSVSDHLQYKYQILVDGHVSAFSRAYWELFSNCVIFKQTSCWYQWFYKALRPYEHYIPYKADASDLIDKINWARLNEDAVLQIIHQANEFANNNLKHSDIMLYIYLLLTKYASLQTF